MKKSYIYFIIPLLGLAVFGTYYWNFEKGYEAHQEEIVAQKAAAVEAKAENEEKKRLKAAEDALAVQAQRKAEREAQAKKDEARAAEKAAAEDSDSKALSEEQSRLRVIDRLNRDIGSIQEEVDQLQRKRQSALVEEDFIKGAIAKAQANQQGLTDVLTKIQTANKIAAEQAAAAAAAAAQH